MDLGFVAPRLTDLDTLESEVLACSVWQDVRPCGGVAGLCDWRLCGGISDLMRRGLLRGERGEVMMIPVRPRLSFEKLLVFGAGPKESFDEEAFRDVTEHMLRTIEGLCSRIAVVQLAGRQDEAISAARATDLLLEAAGTPDARRRHDLWTLVEDGEARRHIEQHMVEEKRRIRRLL
jgi:hypothetical protein